jgi:double-stranded uracil-DNA glycosylase
MTGYQVHVDWMGEQILTLADIWPEHPRAMIVGINPAPASVEAGHYYQGNFGMRQMQRLAQAGAFRAGAGRHVEKYAQAAGIGFTDIVKRPTRGEVDVSPEELEFGKEILVRELSHRGVPLVICVFAEPVRALLGNVGVPGVQPQTTTWGATVFRMPGPSASNEKARAVMSTLSDVLG